jgi:ATP-dependent Clp protease adaptor protein ClpS
MSRLDAVNYISHGIAKRPGMSEQRRVRGAEEWGALHIAESSDALVPCGAKLGNILGRALVLANARQHRYATLDHLLMALIDDQDAAAVLEACAIDVDRMRTKLNDALDQITSPTLDGAPDAKPTAGVQRVILGLALDARRFGSNRATGANLLAGLLSERDYQIRQGQPGTRYKVVLLNDGDTPTEFVVEVLERFFDKGREDAARIMLHVHSDGVGNCGVYTHEIAETKVTQVIDFARQHQHPLQCTMEKD